MASPRWSPGNGIRGKEQGGDAVSERPAAAPKIVDDAERLWFLGTLVRVLLDGEQTGGRFAVMEILFPHGASPPLHSHPQDETFYILEGEVTVWLEERPCRCRSGAIAFAPGGAPHSFRVESDTARMLVLSTPAGIERYVRALSEPAQWPWLQSPSDGLRVAMERLDAVERELGVVRHGPPPETT
jgi:quercetin dioxygenase-like cupin family protein